MNYPCYLRKQNCFCFEKEAYCKTVECCKDTSSCQSTSYYNSRFKRCLSSDNWTHTGNSSDELCLYCECNSELEDLYTSGDGCQFCDMNTCTSESCVTCGEKCRSWSSENRKSQSSYVCSGCCKYCGKNGLESGTSPEQTESCSYCESIIARNYKNTFISREQCGVKKCKSKHHFVCEGIYRCSSKACNFSCSYGVKYHCYSIDSSSATKSRGIFQNCKVNNTKETSTSSEISEFEKSCKFSSCELCEIETSSTESCESSDHTTSESFMSRGDVCTCFHTRDSKAKNVCGNDYELRNSLFSVNKITCDCEERCTVCEMGNYVACCTSGDSNKTGEGQPTLESSFICCEKYQTSDSTPGITCDRRRVYPYCIIKQCKPKSFYAYGNKYESSVDCIGKLKFFCNGNCTGCSCERFKPVSDCEYEKKCKCGISKFSTTFISNDICKYCSVTDSLTESTCSTECRCRCCTNFCNFNCGFLSRTDSPSPELDSKVVKTNA